MKKLGTSTPLVSVILPTFNRARYVAEAIDSVLTQTFSDFELLVVDDGSSDETPRVLQLKAREDDRIHLLESATNGGCNRARNLALGHARGRYVVLLDDDDLALARRIEDTVAQLEANPEVDVVLGNYMFVDARGDRSDQPPPTPRIDPTRGNGDRVFELLYCDWAWFPTSTLTFRASLFKHHRYLDMHGPDGDSILLSQIAASGALFTQLDEPVTLVRRDDSYHYMSRDRDALLTARRQTLSFLRQWLADSNITRFDHLHRRAFSNHLLKEAAHLGGMRGMLRALRGVLVDPRSRDAFDFVSTRLTRRIRGLRLRGFPTHARNHTERL